MIGIRLDPELKAVAKSYAALRGVSLKKLLTDLLIERLKAEKVWPPKRGSGQR